MDILISSNLERLIYQIAGCDSETDAALMKELSETGRYQITPAMEAALAIFTAATPQRPRRRRRSPGSMKRPAM